MIKIVKDPNNKITTTYDEENVYFDLLDCLISYEIYKTRKLKIDYNYQWYKFTFIDKSNKWKIIYDKIPENYSWYDFKKGSEKNDKIKNDKN